MSASAFSRNISVIDETIFTRLYIRRAAIVSQFDFSFVTFPSLTIWTLVGFSVNLYLIGFLLDKMYYSTLINGQEMCVFFFGIAVVGPGSIYNK